MNSNLKVSMFFEELIRANRTDLPVAAFLDKWLSFQDQTTGLHDDELLDYFYPALYKALVKSKSFSLDGSIISLINRTAGGLYAEFGQEIPSDLLNLLFFQNALITIEPGRGLRETVRLNESHFDGVRSFFPLLHGWEHVKTREDGIAIFADPDPGRLGGALFVPTVGQLTTNPLTQERVIVKNVVCNYRDREYVPYKVFYHLMVL